MIEYPHAIKRFASATESLRWGILVVGGRVGAAGDRVDLLSPSLDLLRAMIKHAVLVTGDRFWTDQEAVGRKMAPFPNGTLFVHGNAAGADHCCDEAASELGFPRIRCPYFSHLGRAGGAARNRYMLYILLALEAVGAQIEVLAFHDNIQESKGTKDMVAQARRAGIKVRVFKHGS